MAKPVKVTIDDHRLRELLKRIGDIPSMRVGVIGSEAAAPHADGPETTAKIAARHELGAGVPRRSWLRDWVSESTAEIKEGIHQSMRLLAAGTPAAQAMGLAGAAFVGSIQRRIAKKIPPPNAPSTIKAKGSSTPLIDTGQFRTGITWDVRRG